MTKSQNDEYISLLLEPISVCANYKPKMGHGGEEGLNLEEFQTLYSSDPFYSWFGLDHPLMYAAHKVAGGMTSIYRQIGIGCENLFRKILQDSLKLSDEDSNWFYEVRISKNKIRRLSLDARIPLNKIGNEERKRIVLEWMLSSGKALDINKKVLKSIKGIVFEVRQGYKSKDSKRQNADIANAATAYTQAYLPTVIVLSTQIDTDIVARYRNEKWVILVGSTNERSPLTSTYTFMKEIIGFDLEEFFKSNSDILKKEIDIILQALLNPKSK